MQGGSSKLSLFLSSCLVKEVPVSQQSMYEGTPKKMFAVTVNKYDHKMTNKWYLSMNCF